MKQMENAPVKTPVKRSTIQRELVYNAVQTLRNHPTPEKVYQYIHETHPRVSRGTVYRNLGVLIEEGLIRRVSMPDGADRMDYLTKPHYHLECRKCGGVFDLDMPYSEELNSNQVNSQGYLILGHELVFNGYCNHCRDNASDAVL